MLDKIIKHLKDTFTDPDLIGIEQVKPNPIIIPDYALGERVTQNFPQLKGSALYNTLLNEAPYSRADNIKRFEESTIYPLPKELDAPFELVETAFASRISHTVWILWKDENNYEIINPHQNRGRFLCGPDMINVQDAADPMPENVKFACMIVIGVNLDGNTLRGVRWTFFEKQEK